MKPRQKGLTLVNGVIAKNESGKIKLDAQSSAKVLEANRAGILDAIRTGGKGSSVLMLSGVICAACQKLKAAIENPADGVNAQKLRTWGLDPASGKTVIAVDADSVAAITDNDLRAALESVTGTSQYIPYLYGINNPAHPPE